MGDERQDDQSVSTAHSQLACPTLR
jgi:hypothetical protein